MLFRSALYKYKLRLSINICLKIFSLECFKDRCCFEEQSLTVHDVKSVIGKDRQCNNVVLRLRIPFPFGTWRKLDLFTSECSWLSSSRRFQSYLKPSAAAKDSPSSSIPSLFVVESTVIDCAFKVVRSSVKSNETISFLFVTSVKRLLPTTISWTCQIRSLSDVKIRL